WRYASRDSSSSVYVKEPFLINNCRHKVFLKFMFEKSGFLHHVQVIRQQCIPYAETACLNESCLCSRDGTGSQHSIGRWPVPECGPADVLIKASALAVNHVDLFVRSGAYRTPLPMPFVIGRDCVGQVASTGSG